MIATRFDEVLIQDTDRVGNVLSATMNHGGKENEAYTAVYSYSDSPTAIWLVNTPQQTTISSQQVLKPPLVGKIVTRTTGYLYNAQGDLEWEVVEPGVDANGNIVPLSQPQYDGVQSEFRHYLRDTDGQISSVGYDSQFAAGPNHRSLVIFRDGVDRVFPTRIEDSLSQYIHVAYEPGFGVLAAMQGKNGEYSRFQYDTFGRLKRSEPANGDPASISYLAGAASGSDPQKPSLEEHTASDSGELTVREFNFLEQLVRQRRYTRNDGRDVVIDLAYDAAHRLASRSRPYFEGNNLVPGYDTLTYDAYGRIPSATKASRAMPTGCAAPLRRSI